MSGPDLTQDLQPSFWFSEPATPYDIYHHGIRRVLVQKQTDFQELLILETCSYGNALILDGKWQSSAADEFLYHEPLVHVACVNHGSPKKVLILGGGEGATAREALKWKSVEKVTMVDLDGAVVAACKEHLPEFHQGAFDDPRTELVIADALNFLDQSSKDWDIIISDLSDPIEEGPSFQLFTKEYFEQCKRALKDGGVFVVQAGPTSPVDMEMHVRLVNTVSKVFKNVTNYSSFVPTFASPWGYIIGSESPIDLNPDPEKTDALLREHLNGDLKMFDGITLNGLLKVPKHIRDAIANETRIYSQAEPPIYL